MDIRWSERAESLWAKTGQDSEDWLSLVRHLQDAAAVGRLLWERWLAGGIRQWLDAELDLRGEGATFAAWLAGVHDVGKCSPAFQAQLMEQGDKNSFSDRVVDAGLPLRGPTPRFDWYPHSAASAVAIERWFSSWAGSSPGGIAVKLGEIAGAHHGLPAWDEHRRNAQATIEPAWEAVQDELLTGVTQLTGAQGVLERLDAERLYGEHQTVLTALVIMADWIASNQDLFPLNVPRLASSAERAEEAWADLDLGEPWTTTPLPPDEAAAYQSRFVWPSDRTPWPVQVDALQAARAMDGPGLICIEAPMGVGKTEAALMAADELARRTGRTGIMVAAPTMATSDALYARVSAWARRAGAPDRPASLFLAHSKAALNEEAQDLPRRGPGMRSVGEDEPREVGAVVAHQWLAGRKKGLLASIAVGTVDQVLLMALQAKHSMLRHLALASKVVVIDEVHAYDAYMNQYLERALHWLGVYRVPVILLSATLPHASKARLVAAYRSGLTGAGPQPAAVPDAGLAYPVLTIATPSGVDTVESAASGREHRVRLEPMADDDASLASVMTRVRDEGGCLLVVCNTVARAQDAYRTARAIVGEDARLLHARFISSDRLHQERELLQGLGPEAAKGRGRPDRRIVVATQVVEQSLDVDFDAMVTDIAPVDLVLQRAGRVHRHARPEAERPAWARLPTVLVRGMESPGGWGLAPKFQPSQERVYPAAALLASVACLGLHIGGGHVRIPADIPRLVRAAYALNPDLPAAWATAWSAAAAARDAHQAEQRSRATTFLVPSPQSVEVFSHFWERASDDRRTGDGEARGLAQVRDAEPTLEVLLTRIADDGYTTLHATDDDPVMSADQVPPWAIAQRIAASSVRLPSRFSWPALFDAALDQLEQVTDPAWQQSPLLKGQLQLNVDTEGGAVLAGHRLRYDTELGLVEEKE